jgi:hypothetical protein
MTLFLFTAVTLTHAAFVDYRSGAAETQSQFKAMQDSKLIPPNQMPYLQTRKLAGAEITLGDFGGYGKRGVWRGMTKSKWIDSGLCCGVFDLLIKMKGGKTRTALLKSLSGPKNKLQLSQELDIDWKAVDRHISKMLEYGLVAEVAMVGTCKVFATTHKGRRALEIVKEYETPEDIECT